METHEVVIGWTWHQTSTLVAAQAKLEAEVTVLEARLAELVTQLKVLGDELEERFGDD